MLVLKDISLGFGGRQLFRNINWQMKERDRVALIGGNGVGKSTLMKIIAGLNEPDTGDVLSPKGYTFGYLPQDGIEFKGRPLFEEVKSVLSEILDLEKNLKELEGKLASQDPDSDAYVEILEVYDREFERFRQLDGYRMEAEVGRVLEGLGFAKEDWERPCETFSGGWQMRIALARLLLLRPNVLLLDEPTNHLDLEARNWLESYLTQYPSSVLMVSHDRHFLDVVVNRCTELFMGALDDYHGNYTFFEREREARYNALVEAKRRQDEEIEKLERFIERFRYKATKATQVQSRVKQLEKIERIELPPNAQTVSFSFPEPRRSGRIVMELKKVTKSYDGVRNVLDEVDLSIERQSRVALVGANGAGKSTLMRIIAGQDSFEGEKIDGYQMDISYFAQDQAKVLNPDHTILQSLEELAPYDMLPRLRSLLGCFLFQGDDVEKKVKVLSGGERNRVALARMLLRPANFLLLDEPTNHLDIQSKEVLLDALKRFEGTILFVSHDRFFINQLAETIVEVRDGKLETFLGDYEDYLTRKMQRGDIVGASDGVEWSTASDVSGVQGGVQKQSASKKPNRAVSSDKQQHEKDRLEEQERKRQRKKTIRRLKQEIESIEAALEQDEARLEELEGMMGQPGFYDDYEASSPVLEEHGLCKERIEASYTRWDELSLELAEFEESDESS